MTTAQPTQAPEPTAAPTQEASAPSAAVAGDLVVIGAVEKPLGLKEADLRGMEVAKITAEHPKSGAAEYEGVRLSDLLALAVPAASAAKIVFTAADGYSAEAAAGRRAGLRRLHGGLHRHARQAQARHAWPVQQPVGEGCRQDRAEVSTT